MPALRVASHVLVTADQPGQESDPLQADRTRKTSRRFLTDAKHEKLLQKVKHVRLLQPTAAMQEPPVMLSI
jgi:hypothetical protein